uniref:Putative secreted protein n=1 Tax=Xenopsylla cheopis TaxID=163159 RepID=A0A6M2E0I0_XENCH
MLLTEINLIYMLIYIFLLIVVSNMVLSLPTLCNTSSFVTLSVYLMSIFLQHHISKLSDSFSRLFRSILQT